MQEKHIYEYAVIRIVPRVEREEFINAGIVIYCKRKKYIKVLVSIDEAKLLALHPSAEVEQIKLNLDSFERIAAGAKDGGPIAKLEIDERFRWLTAVRSSVIQTSRPHPGLCTDPEVAALKLFRENVL